MKELDLEEALRNLEKLTSADVEELNKVFVETWPAPGSVVRDPVTGGLFEV